MKTEIDRKPKHARLPGWLKCRGHDVGNDPTALKLALAGEGVRARGVRLYLDYGDALFAPLTPDWIQSGDACTSCARALAYLHLLQACEMDVAPPYALVRAIAAARLPLLGARHAHLFRSAWRALCQAQYMGVAQDRWLADECVPLLRWAISSDGADACGERVLKTAWPTLHRQWQADLRNRALPLPRAEWPVPIGHATMPPGILWVPLASAAALAEEGEIMHHCVGDYAERCRSEGYAVYSLRKLPCRRRVATLGLIRDPRDSWQIDEFKAHSNATPDTEAHAWAEQFLGRIVRGTCYPDDAIEDAEWRTEAYRMTLQLRRAGIAPSSN